MIRLANSPAVTARPEDVEDELLPANPALRMGKYRRQADDAEPEMDPFTRAEASHLVAVAREKFPDWHPFVLCGLRTGMRMGELLALEWGDVDWHTSTIRLSRNIVRGALTTPKNHQKRRVDL